MASEYDGRVGSVRGPAVPLFAYRGSGVARCDSAVFLRLLLGRWDPAMQSADIQVATPKRFPCLDVYHVGNLPATRALPSASLRAHPVTPPGGLEAHP